MTTSAAMDATGIELRVEGISKQFGETRALSDVSLSVLPGSVHALVGENGAGKSTLGRIVAGVLAPDSGRVLIDGRPVELGSPKDALALGIATIAQELALVPTLDATANVLLGVEHSRFGLLQGSSMRRRYATLAASAGFSVPSGRPVGALSVAQQQQVEILRALSRDARLIVMDEPSARLSGAETEKLHAVIRELSAGGRSVLLISHFLDEVLAVADQVTVLRDGRVVSQGPTAGASAASLIEAMLGRTLGAQFPERRLPPPDTPVVLETIDLSGPGFEGVSLNVRAGEIVGLAGLVGAGRSELGRAIVGAAPVSGGEVRLAGQALRARSPRDALRRGLLMIPESRREQGLLYLRSLSENVSLSSLERFSRMGLIRGASERRAAGRMLERVAVSASPRAPVATLSGGNQQKVLFARAMLPVPRALIADEPTRGVDVGAKRAIYDLLVQLAGEGMAILLISSEMEEILGLAHRVVVMRAGRLAAELGPAEMSEQAILKAAFETQAEAGGSAGDVPAVQA
ncbi:MAG TPA: sugar ABC transporter ATP-binding protein [Candidatus Limnocylindria bacterium]|nr:sugar ABC transporter ATP-binding protein [Candidatus Limnocylindria bacterium]